jgi:hypothetical protein
MGKLYYMYHWFEGIQECWSIENDLGDKEYYMERPWNDETI